LISPIARFFAFERAVRIVPRYPRFLIVPALIGAISAAATAREAAMVAGPIEATVVAVTDGDTLVVEARIWPDQTVTTSVRLDGIDAPELRGACEEERGKARAARDLLSAIAGHDVRLTRVRHDKYGGRVIARVLDGDGRDVGLTLVEAGLARAYDGGAREPWCGADADGVLP
jgi:endonuclease YncB( thermonuclease family)